MPRCNWCSAPLPSDHETVCPSCGATLIGDGDPSVPGLTAIDAEAILRSARAAKAKPRSRLLGWISGDVDDEVTTNARPGSLAPPPADVRREILRLELEAQVANAQAEVESMAADHAIEHGLSLTPAPETPAGEAPTLEATTDTVAATDAPTADPTTVAEAPATHAPVVEATKPTDEAPPA